MHAPIRMLFDKLYYDITGNGNQDGSITECKLNSPTGLYISNTKVYITELGAIRELAYNIQPGMPAISK